MAKKKSCQNIRVPRVLSEAERDLYGWVDEEIFTHPSVVEADMLLELRLKCGVRLGFTEFQRVVLSRCRVAASQLHLNWWGFLRTYQLHAPPPRKGFMSFHAHSDRKLFDSFEESIQECKCHYFKLDDKGTPFPWVYWNSEVGDYRITALDPLETLAFEFLQSLPAGLWKKSNFKCHWILDHSDAEVGVFLDSLLKDIEK
ncbi:hypothetical protein PIB30_066711 [Stylosanthes scabra]|uniref:Transposase n=1 Tax=Stylosanthes scabra TaxID=79078 RepID=A0ABU6WQN7_9FABA|nr:hypothetical protein [Stylosanthes scabra]